MKTSIFTSVIILAAFLALAPASATTVRKLTFEEMVNTSELIIEGEVDSIYTAGAGKLVHTRVLIRVLDVLKGDYPGEYIELDFLGGNDEGRTLVVSGQDIPDEGEKGFYFIEEAAAPLVNPLTGWSQGHFRILTDQEGNEYLETDIQQDLVDLSNNEGAALAAKMRNMRFTNEQVEQAYFSPVTPDELRDAVSLFSSAE